MKSTYRHDPVFLMLPVLSLVVSVGIVCHQSARRDHYKNELVQTTHQVDIYAKRYQDLKQAGAKEPTATSPDTEIALRK